MGICQTQDHRGKGQFSLQEKRKGIKYCLKWGKDEGRETIREGGECGAEDGTKL